jgi:hypothetical protein
MFLRLKIFILFLLRKLNFVGIMRTIFYDKWYVRALKLENYLTSKGWIYLGSGKDRRVWRRGNVVIKIAYVESGILANKFEHQIYRKSLGKETKYAPCRLISENILMMRAVREFNNFSLEDELLIPTWAYELNDGSQIGIDRNGRIMAFDYAEEMENFNRYNF